jgi:hypothetical protein
MSALETLLKSGSVDELRTAVATLAAIVQAERHVVRHSEQRDMRDLSVLRGHGIDSLVDAVEQLVKADKAYCESIARQNMSADKSRDYNKAASEFDKMTKYFTLFSV